MKIYRIFKGNYPSLAHGGYRDEVEAKTEVARLEGLRSRNNELANTLVPDKTRRGWAFMQKTIDNDEWQLRSVEVDE